MKIYHVEIYMSLVRVIYLRLKVRGTKGKDRDRHTPRDLLNPQAEASKLKPRRAQQL